MALHVDRDRPAKLRTAFAHCQMRGARVEPDVENVGLLSERACAALTGVTGGQKIRCRSIEPSIRSLGAEILADLLEELRTGDRLIALLAVQNRDWNAP